MNLLDSVDPELRGFLEIQPKLRLNQEKLVKSRAFIVEAAKSQKKPDLPGLSFEQIEVPGAFEGPPIRVLVYRPSQTTEPIPAMVHMHGGGYVMGVPEMADTGNRQTAMSLNCAIFSVDYRLAPESPYPAAMQDAYSVLVWLHAHADELGIDPARIGLKGESAGGGVAAAVAQYARDHKGPAVAFQHLIFPMLDDRTALRKDVPAHIGKFFWTEEHNRFGWRALLGDDLGAGELSPYASPARATEFGGLPPTFIAVGGVDLFIEENIRYATLLNAAGVPVELHVYPGAYHGFQLVAQARVSQQFERDSLAALRRAMYG